jgi:prepilin-type processing-associated H-X9-DG protein
MNTETTGGRGSYRLGELAVVLVTTGTLAAVLIPACERNRGAPRKVACQNNLRNLALACTNYAKDGPYPRLNNRVTPDLDFGWGAAILPQLDRHDLWMKWKEGIPQKIDLEVMRCPSDIPYPLGPGEGPCSYAANIFIFDPEKPLRIRDIADGAEVTALLAENLRSKKPHNYWDIPPTDGIAFGAGAMEHTAELKNDLGSRHGGAVNIAYVDCHVRLLSDTMSSEVYSALVTPANAPNEPALDASQF